mgnify:CR=1 FL=1
MNANPIWLKSYPEGVPADINPNAYSSLVGLLEDSFSKFSDRTAYCFMGKTSFPAVTWLRARVRDDLHTNLRKSQKGLPA